MSKPETTLSRNEEIALAFEVAADGQEAQYNPPPGFEGMLGPFSSSDFDQAKNTANAMRSVARVYRQLAEAEKRNTMDGWIAYSDPTEVVPVNDLKPHDYGEMCDCKPFWDDGVLVHNSYNEREKYERGERKSS